MSHEIPQSFINEIQQMDSTTFVGPFFYIGGKIFASKKKVSPFDQKQRFFDSEISHFDFFNTLLIDGDYGNYPRGRVIYDSLNSTYLIYMDKSLFRKNIKEQILMEFGLQDEKVSFKNDTHYTHDYL